MSASILTIATFLLLSSIGLPQTPAAGTEAISLSVVVSTEDDRAVTGLSLKDFRLFEDQTEQIIESVRANTLAGDYTLTYTPKNSVRDGSFRKVRVETILFSGKRLAVRHAQGYIAWPK
jgi:hypothetical protein